MRHLGIGGTLRRLLALSVMAALVLTFCVPSAYATGGSPSSEVSTSNLKKLKEQMAQIEKERKEAKAELDKLAGKKAGELAEKKALDKQICLCQKEIETIESMIEQLDSDISETTLKLDQTTKQEAETYEAYKERLKSLEEMGEVGFWSAIVGSESFADMLSRVDLIREILDNDQHMVEELEEMRDSIDLDKQNLEQYKETVDHIKGEMSDRKSELETQMSRSQQILEELSKDEAEQKEQLKKADKERDELEKMIAKVAAELAKKNSMISVGAFLWPVSGYTRVSSPFGMRIHPIYKTRSRHTGIDIPAPMNTNILCANNGTVALTGYNSAYGNYVMVDHGGGYATYYAHLTRYIVSEGQKVKKGQVIAKMGSTGLSTGSHLHFEILKNGSRVDPMNYFKKG